MPDDPNTPLEAMEFDDPNEELFFAVAWCDRAGVAGDFLAKLRRAHERGADLDGANEDGETPLTGAILDGEGAPAAVAVLLELGADPSRRAESGWTPWGACVSRIADRVVRRRMEEIQVLLAEHGADRGDEAVLAFEQAVVNGDAAEARELLRQGIDLASPVIDPLAIAARRGDLAMAQLLLESGANLEGNEQDEEAESPLVCAATQGHLEMAQLLVGAGAQVDRHVYGDPVCTAEFLARDAGHEEVADWLRGQSSKTTGPVPGEAPGGTDPKFAPVYELRTSAPNFDLTTAQIVNVLSDWNRRFGVEISEVAGDRLTVRFARLPDDVASLAREIYDFCPDLVDQGFGCLDDVVAMAEETGEEIPPDLQALVDGVDFEGEDFGLEILARELAARGAVSLWWD